MITPSDESLEYFDSIEFITAPESGIRISDRVYGSGETVPIKYRRRMDEPSRPIDPMMLADDAPPNLGRSLIPHTMTFSGMLTTLSRAFRNPDAAIQHSIENANSMLLDPAITGPLFARQKMVSLLNWHIEPEDDNDPKLKAVAERMTKILHRTDRFVEYRRSLLMAIWTGRHANQHRYGWHINSAGKRSTYIRKWEPIDGDKLVFRYNDGSAEFDDEEFGVRVSPAHVKEDVYAGKWQVEYYSQGSAVFWEEWERKRVCLHKHFIQDAPFEEPDRGGSIHGLGLRNYLYWAWYMKQEVMAKMVELVERSALGLTIYFYAEGNPEAKKEMRKVAQESAHTNVILIPKSEANPIQANDVLQIPPNVQGIEALRVLLDDYFGSQITKMILGQTLSTKAEATGIGTGVADLHLDSLKQIIKYDAVNLEETLTKGVLHPLIELNEPRYMNHDFWFRIATEAAIPEKELEAIFKLYEMGAEIRTSDVFDRVGLGIPSDGEDKLMSPEVRLAQQQIEIQDMELQQAQQQAMMPQQPAQQPAPGQAPPPGEPEEPAPQEPQQAACDDRYKIFGPILNRKKKVAGKHHRTRYAEPAEAAEQPERKPWSLKSQDVIGKMRPGNAPAENVGKMLSNAGVRDEEMQWTGLGEHLQQGGTASKEELAGKSFGFGEVVDSGPNTGYDEQVLTPGENYREVALTLPHPEQEEIAKQRAAIDREIDNNVLIEGEPDPEKEARQDELFAQLAKLDETSFQSPHSEAPNVLLHKRTHEHTATDGVKTILLETIQSDWHQQGREHGYRDADWEKKTDLEKNTSKAVPDAPFKRTQDWSRLALIHTIEDAVKGGLGRVAWTTGDQQVRRWSGGDRSAHGLREYYDTILPNVASKIIKRYGGQVGSTEIPTGDMYEPPITVHSFDITPAMRESVLQHGQQLFGRGGEPDRYNRYGHPGHGLPLPLDSGGMPNDQEPHHSAAAPGARPPEKYAAGEPDRYADIADIPEQEPNVPDVPAEATDVTGGEQKPEFTEPPELPPVVDVLKPADPIGSLEEPVGVPAKPDFERTPTNWPAEPETPDTPDVPASGEPVPPPVQAQPSKPGVFESMDVAAGKLLDRGDELAGKIIDPVTDIGKAAVGKGKDYLGSLRADLTNLTNNLFGEQEALGAPEPPADKGGAVKPPKGAVAPEQAVDAAVMPDAIPTAEVVDDTERRTMLPDRGQPDTGQDLHERINRTANMIGKPAFKDPGSPQAQQFIMRAASSTMEGHTPTDVNDAMDHLEKNEWQMNNVVGWARQWGFVPQGNLVDSSVGAATHLMHTAVQQDWKVPYNNPQKNLAAAMWYLSERSPDADNTTALGKLQTFGKENWLAISIGLLGLAWFSGKFDRN